MLIVLLSTFISGVVGTLIGALSAVIFKLKSDRAIGLISCFAGGFMIAIAAFDLIPESIEITNVYLTVIGVVVGVGLIIILDRFLGCGRKISDKEQEINKFERMGLLMIIAVSLHNFPEGMAIGSMGALNNPWSLTLLIMLHNIPEGLVMAVPLYRAGYSKIKCVLMVALSGLPTIFGGLCGFLVGNVSPWFASICLSLAAGTMLYIVFEETLKEGYEHSRPKSAAMLTIVGVIVGLLLISFIG